LAVWAVLAKAMHSYCFQAEMIYLDTYRHVTVTCL